MMNVIVTEMYNRSVLYDRIKVCKINQKGLFTLICKDGSRIIGSFEEVTSIQIDEEGGNEL